MTYLKRILIVILLSLMSVSAYSQESFSGTEAFKYIRTLCKPEFEGRKTGLEGARKAAQWIASKFEEWGLEPAGDNGAFIQEFPMIVTHQKKKSRLVLKNGLFGPVRYQQGNDYTVYFNSGSGKVTTEVIFAGFGISEPEKGWDDFAGIDVTGKIILIYRGLPQDGKDWSPQNERDYKMQIATAKGAAGLIILEARDWAIRGGTLHEEGYDPTMPAIAVSKKVARDIFQGTYKNLDHTLRDLAKKPQSFNTGKIMTLDLKLTRIQPGVGENVIGLVRGTDPVLKNEYIVLGGHMDHNGVNPQGLHYVGADDNASGTAVIMELARSLAASPHKPKRSVLFAGWGGEEQGLRGSKYFADHPTVEGQNIGLAFNFDMEGAGSGGGGFGGRNYFPPIIDKWVKTLCDSVQKNLRVGRGWGYGGSDHAPFIARGIPAFGFFSTGDHPFYHRVEDTPRTINVQSLQFIGDRAAELLHQFANQEESLLYDGNHQGRFFLHFGNQMELEGGPYSRLMNLDPDSLMIIASQGCIHGTVVTLTRGKNWEEDAHTFYDAADDFHSGIKEQKNHLFLYRNGGSLNQSSGSGELAVALGLHESDLDADDMAMFRNLVKLGVRFLHISDPAAPLFTPEGWSPFGKSILQICQSEKVSIIWSIDDALFTRNKLPDIKGNVILRLNPDDARHAPADFEDLVEGKNRLAYIECKPGTQAQDLADLAERYGIQNIHFSVLHRCAEKKASPCTGQALETWAYSLFQQFYELHLESKEALGVYRDMENLLGRNLRTVLNN